MHPALSGAGSSPAAGADPGGAIYRFGQFTLYPARKLLACGDCPVVLGGRAFDLLVALVMRAGEVVSHHDLVAAVWPHAVVEENGLRVHMSALRKALGECPADQYIVTVLGRGYRFVKQVSPGAAARADGPRAGWSALPPLPCTYSRAARLLGRDAVAAELAACLARGALVTVTGAGGIGKSAVALAHAASQVRHYGDGVHIVDFAQAGDAAMVAGAIGSALGIALQHADPLGAVSQALVGLHALLVFDNCEHVLPEVARFAARITAAAPRVALLATSRAPLGLAGEQVVRLPPLALPEGQPLPDCDAALGFPAIALFVERAQANASEFALTSANLPLVARLCQQLDGLPLAIELAAARVEALGVEGLVARLDDMFRLLTRSRRLASPRHAALEAMLDCSYRLLDGVERTLLRRLSVFHDSFSLESAVLVCAFEALAPEAVRAALPALVAKSLLAPEPGPGAPRYRCLNLTRRYAAAHLAASGEANAVARRHAVHLRALLAQARAEIDGRPLSQWRSRHGRLSADLLAALDWAFGEDGEAQLGLVLCAAVPLPLLELGMLDGFRRRIETALAVLARGALAGPALEACLLAIWTLATAHVAVPPEQRAAMYERLLHRAPAALEPDGRALVCSAVCLAAFAAGDLARIGAVTREAAGLARTRDYEGRMAGQVMGLLAERWDALRLHFQGRYPEARVHARQALESVLPGGAAHVLGPIPQPVAIGVILARSDWLEGRADTALARARQVLAIAETEHPFALALALGVALVPVALWRGDDALALQALERLETHARRHALGFWCEWAEHLRRVLGAATHDALEAAPGQVGALPLMRDLMLSVRPDSLSEPELAAAERGQDSWCAPELLRIRAARAHVHGAALLEVEAGLARASVAAQAQGALAWELRCAVSLAMLWREQGRSRQGRTLLAGVLARFAEGFDTGDLRGARALHAQLAAQPGDAS